MKINVVMRQVYYSNNFYTLLGFNKLFNTEIKNKLENIEKTLVKPSATFGRKC